MIEIAATPLRYPWSFRKRFLVIFLVAGAFLAGPAITNYYVSVGTEIVERETGELLNAQLAKVAIGRDLVNVASDLMFLARHNGLQGMFENGDPELRRILAKQFLIFSTKKGIYDQIRLLDQTGMEVIRVNYNNGNPTVVPEAQLQSKAQRYYFEKTSALARDEMYISPLDLNIERGQIEQPPKPLIRFGTPVFDRSGRKRGILLLNYLGANLIRDFKSATANISDHAMLLNSDGYWLSGPSAHDEWGFMYDSHRTFAKAYPDAWQRVQANDVGQFYNDQGMFSFTTIYPLERAAGEPWPGGQKVSPATDKGYYWKAVSHMPPQSLATARDSIFRQNLLLYTAIFGLLVVASILLARASVGRGRAATQAEKDPVVEQPSRTEKMAAVATSASGIGREIDNHLHAIREMAEAIQDEDDVARCRRYGRDIVTRSKQIAEIAGKVSGGARSADEHDLEPVDVNE